MALVVFIVNYILMILFIKEYYIFYFLALFISTYFVKLNPYVTVIIIFISVFTFQYFDDSIYYLYLYFDVNELYTFVGGEVMYILSLLHVFVFFLGYNRRKYL